MNPDTDWLLAYILRACKDNIVGFGTDLWFFQTLRRTPALCAELLGYVMGKLDYETLPDMDGLLQIADNFLLCKSHIYNVTNGHVGVADIKLREVSDGTGCHDASLSFKTRNRCRGFR